MKIKQAFAKQENLGARTGFIKPQTRKSFITYGIVIIAFIVMQTLTATGNISSMLKGLLIPLCVYSMLAVSLNLTVGILGELSLGQAGFMCVGAYTSAIFSIATSTTITESWIRFPLALLVGGVVAALFGVLIGIPVLRLKGDYLAIVTLAFGEIIKNVFAALYLGYDSKGLHFSLKSLGSLNLEPDGKLIINGPQGISGTPNDSTFIIGFILLLLTLIISYNFVYSRTGRAVMSIRDNRIAAESIGLNITTYAKDGKQICEPIYDNLSFSKDGNSVFCIFKKDGKTGAMNVQGKVIVQPNSLYNKMLFYAKDGFNYLDHSGKFVPIGIDVNGNALVNKQKIGKPSKKNKENSMERVVVFYPYSSCIITDAKGKNEKNSMKPQGSFSAEIEFREDTINAYFYDVTKETKNILLGFVFDLKTSEISINKEEKKFSISDAETKIIVSEPIRRSAADSRT